MEWKEIYQRLSLPGGLDEEEKEILEGVNSYCFIER